MMRVAVIGLGIGEVHLEEYKAHPGAEITAVVDIHEDARNVLAAEYGVPGFASIAEMLGAAEVDAVSLCTPPGGHAEQVEDLAGAGIHVLVEKPMASSLEHCSRMIDAARNANVKLMVAQKKRFSAPYVFLKENFEGEFGEPRWASVKYALGRVDKDCSGRRMTGAGRLSRTPFTLSIFSASSWGRWMPSTRRAEISSGRTIRTR